MTGKTMEEFTRTIVAYKIFGNSLLQIALAAGVLLVALAAVSVVKRLFEKRSSRAAEGEKPTFSLRMHRMRRYSFPLAYTVLAYLVLTTILTVPARHGKNLYIAFVIIVSIFALRLVSFIIKDSLKAYLLRRDKERDAARVEKSISGISTFINIIVWSVGFIFIIDNIGFNISAIVTGLGIGGVAIALASQTVLHDLFSYFVIFFDEPFKIGDFIIIDDKMGTVEKIGIKTTRIQSLSGEQIVISNASLTNGRIHNYKRMEKRRVVQNIGVVYQTTPEQIEAIPHIVRKIIDSTSGVQFDRTHFKEYGDSGLIFEIVYYIMMPDFNYYMDRQHEINLEIFRKFSEMKIGFAYPTRTIFIEKN